MKKFLSAVLIAGSLLLMSPVHAEIQTYTGTDEYIIGERETIEQAKEHSKTRALRNAREQAGIYIRSRSRSVNLELVEDEILTIAEGVLKIIGAPKFEQRLLDGGKGILIFTTINVEIDTDEVNHLLEKFLPQQKSPAIDNITLSKQKFDEGFKLCLDRKFREAIPILNEALKLNPNNGDAYRELGWAYTKLGKYDEALFYRRKAVELNPNDFYAVDGIAVAYIGLEKYDKAISVCNEGIKLNPNFEHFYCNRGFAYKGLKNYEQALLDFNRCIEINPNHKWAHVGRGNVYKSLGEREKAQKDFAKARKLGWKG